MLKMKNTIKIGSIMLLGTLLSSCGGDDKDYSVPNSYNFSNASYSGQTARINMLKELSTYMKSAVSNAEAVSEQQLLDMYANSNYTWTSAPFSIDQPTKQLKNKTFSGEVQNMENLMSSLASISTSTSSGSNGNAGLVSSADGSKTYLFDANGMEPVQLIEKGLMASVFYYQATSVYLSEAKVGGANNTVNVVDKDYTAMQHYWDEAFGYLAAPIDLNEDNIEQKKTDGELAFYSKYLLKTVAADLPTVKHLMKRGFINGRAAIDNKDYDKRDEATEYVRNAWEMINVAAGLHYLNGALADIGDDALRNHKLSEAYAFIKALKFNSGKTITDTDIDAALAALGTNFYTISPSQIEEAKTILGTAFDVNPSDF
ncbi:MAG: DUF4856 domain-containing protein [Flavobacteriales bacterium]